MDWIIILCLASLIYGTFAFIFFTMKGTGEVTSWTIISFTFGILGVLYSAFVSLLLFIFIIILDGEWIHYLDKVLFKIKIFDSKRGDDKSV